MRKKTDEFNGVNIEIWSDENGNERELIIFDALEDEQLAVFEIEEEE